MLKNRNICIEKYYGYPFIIFNFEITFYGYVQSIFYQSQTLWVTLKISVAMCHTTHSVYINIVIIQLFTYYKN